MNKPVYLGISLLELSKILMCEFWNDYVKQKCSENAKLCYGFIGYIKIDDISEYTAEDPETRPGTLSNELEIKNVIELTKIALGRNHDKIFSMKSKNL